jgi:hypothetical protein
MSNDILTIYCAVHGEVLLFPIEIESTTSVGILKDRIHARTASNQIDSRVLVLWKFKISIHDADELEAKLKSIKLDGSDVGIEKMNVVSPLSRYFSLDNNFVEVVLVQPPAVGELYRSARVCQSC